MIKRVMIICQILVISIFLFPNVVKAENYSTTNDLFENSYTNNLIDMSETQVENFINKKYVIIQINYDYYIITAKKEDVSVNYNVITLKNSKIIRCIRNQNGYNYYYDYSTFNDNTTTIYVNNIVVSNIDTTKSVSSKRYEDYKNGKYSVNLLMFILGLCFALFLTKERNY